MISTDHLNTLGSNSICTKCLLIQFLSSLALVSLSQEYSIKQFSIDDGLPSAHVYEVKQDRQGFYWVATDKGVVKYDGYTFSQIQDDSNPFNKDIWWTYQDSKDRIWGLGLGTKIWYLEGDSFKFNNPTFEDKGSTSVFHKMYEDKSGCFWLIAGSRLYGFKDNENYRVRTEDVNSSIYHDLPHLFKAKDDELYYITKYPVEIRRVKPKGEFELTHVYEEGIFAEIYYTKIKNRPSLIGPNDFDSDSTTLIIRSPDTLYVI